MRHGATQANEGKPVVRAWKDFPLDPAKKYEVELTAGKLREYDPQYIASSDLVRDTETAHIVGEKLQRPKNETDFASRTWDVGKLEGRPLEEVNCVIEGLYKRPWELPPGSMESFNDFSRRWIGFFDRMVQLATIDAFRPVLIVTHGKNIALTKSYLEGGNAEDSIMPLPAGFAVVSLQNDGEMTIEMKSDTEPVIEDV